MEQLSTARKWFLRLALLLFFSSLGIIIPYLPVIFTYKGMSSAQVGILMAIGPFVSTSVNFLWGYVSDQLQTVKKVIIFLLVMAVLTGNFMFNCDTFWWMVIAVTFFYAFYFPVIPLLDSITLGLVKYTGESYGKYRLWGSAGFAVSAGVAGSVFEVVGIDSINIFYTALALSCALSCMLLLDTAYKGERATKEQVKKVLGRKEVVIFLIMVAVLSMTNKANDAFIGLYINHLGGGEKIIGWAWTLAPLSEIPVFALSGLLFARFHQVYLLAAASVIFALRWLLFSVVTSPEMIIPIQMLHSLSFGLFLMSAVAYMGRLVPHYLRASGQGLLSSVIGGLGGISGAYLGGAMFSFFGPADMYSILAYICVIVFIAFVIHYRQVMKKLAEGKLHYEH